MKKVFITTILALCMVGLFTVNAIAAAGWFTCTVVDAGIVRTDEVLITLTDDGASFTDLRFTAKTGREKEMLATALTAISSDLKVKVWANPALGTIADRILESMYLVAP